MHKFSLAKDDSRPHSLDMNKQKHNNNNLQNNSHMEAIELR